MFSPRVGGGGADPGILAFSGSQSQILHPWALSKCQIPYISTQISNPGDYLRSQNPYHDVKLPWLQTPPTMGLNTDRCTILRFEWKIICSRVR